MNVAALGIPSMREDRLSTIIPRETWHRYGRFEPSNTLYMFRAGRFDDRGVSGTLGFYIDDYRLEALWSKRSSYTSLFANQEWGCLIAPDFSLWADDPIAEQIWNVYRSRSLVREWQDAGIMCAPNLGWSTPESYEFCFEGIPRGCPVAFCQARTVDVTERPLFLEGLNEAVSRLAPITVVLYGNASWLADSQLPAGPKYVRLSSMADGMRASDFGRVSAVTASAGGCDPNMVERICVECGAPFLVLPKSKMMRCSAKCDQRLGYRNRRARLLDAFVENVDLGVIANRDRFICGLCGKPVDMTLRHPNRMSPTIDHRVPLAHGGLHSKANCHLAHFSCNCSKGAKFSSTGTGSDQQIALGLIVTQ